MKTDAQAVQTLRRCFSNLYVLGGVYQIDNDGKAREKDHLFGWHASPAIMGSKVFLMTLN